jgi:four helix bundle protein
MQSSWTVPAYTLHKLPDKVSLLDGALVEPVAVAVYRATGAFPRREQFGLASQMRRAALSVASNIVERCARHSQRDYIHFLDIAYGSCHELEYQVSLCH